MAVTTTDPTRRTSGIFTFPNPVNEVAARAVATGVVLMAVTFVVGNANRLSASILDPGSTIASRIANEFNEALGLQLNALIALGCILFFVTFVVLVIARLLVARVKRY